MTEPGSSPGVYVMSGIVVATLPFGGLVAIERPGRFEARVHVNGATRITVNGRVAALDEVRRGWPIRVLFDVIGDVAVATEIAIPGS